MSTNWKKAIYAAIISSSFILPNNITLADGSKPTVSVEQSASYQLTDSLHVEVKSLFNERTSDGIRIASVVRMKNEGSKVARVPEFELRARTEEGIEYTLHPGAANVRSIQPKAKVELSYLATIDRRDPVQLSELSWVDVDWYVYPKREAAVLSVPVAGVAWHGSDTVIEDQSAVKKWGEPFVIRAVNSPLIFNPVSIHKDYAEQAPVTIIKLLVQNPAEHRESVPDFSLEGRSVKDAFLGKRVESGKVTLEPGEKRYIHYAINTEQDTELKNIYVVTPEYFSQIDVFGKLSSVHYSVGRLNIQLPGRNDTQSYNAVAYTLNESIPFDPLNQIIHPDVNVAMVELNMHENQGLGYKTVVAKFKLSNKSSEPLGVPLFQTELTGSDGSRYAGSRQTSVTQRLMPHLSHIVTYSFIVPVNETGEDLTLRLLDGQSAAPYKSEVSAMKVAVQQQPQIHSVLSFYPFEVKVNYWILNAATTLNPSITYTYKLKLNLDIKQLEGVVVDQDFSKMVIALMDPRGRVIAEEPLSFIANTPGSRKLVSGETTVNFTNLRVDQQEFPLSFHIYESINTAYGEAKRLVASYKQ